MTMNFDSSAETSRLTTVRHGNKDSFIEWLKRQGYTLTVVEGSRENLQSLEPKDRFYGHLLAGCKILLVEAGGGKDIPTRFWHITLD